MRFVPAIALAALTAAPALAQTQYADSSGGFVSLRSLSFSGARFDAVDGTAGYRFATGTDVGIRYAHSGGFLYASDRIGPIAGLTRPLGAGFTGRVEASVLFETVGGTGGDFVGLNDEYVPPFEFRVQSLYEDVSATVSRRVPLVGSVALRPTVGGYATALQRISVDYPAASTGLQRSRYSGGVQYEIPVTFRVFGQDAAVVPGGRFSLTGTPFLGDDAYVGSGFRLNF